VSESWLLNGFVSSTWADEDYMSSYFGIDAADAARSGLDEFSADEGFKDVTFGGGVSYRLFDRWSVSAIATYARLIDDAADSPVVDDVGDENQFFAGALVNYTF
jgi:outer membrane scaffolding protein for murein synthesis (MipA/OmpV family)